MTFSSYNTYQLTSGELTSESHTLGLSHHHWTLTWISSSLKLFNKFVLITMQVIVVNYSVQAAVPQLWFNQLTSRLEQSATTDIAYTTTDVNILATVTFTGVFFNVYQCTSIAVHPIIDIRALVKRFLWQRFKCH